MNITRKWAVRVGLLIVLAGGAVGTTGCITPGFIAVGTVVEVLPHGYVTVTVGRASYFYHRGVYYRRARPGFVVVHAPIGAVIPILPSEYVWVTVGPDRYAYHHGAFYSWLPRRDRYVVVRAPAGAVVRRLPDGAVTRRVGGVEYKEYAGVHYRPVRRGSDTVYEVTRPQRRPR